MECDVFCDYFMKEHSSVTAKAFRALHVVATAYLCALDDCSLIFELVTDEWEQGKYSCALSYIAD